MDGLVTYVDLAEKASRYSFQLTGLHSGGEAAKEVKQEKEERVEKEEVGGKGDKAQSVCLPLLLQQIYLISAATEEKSTRYT